MSPQSTPPSRAAEVCERLRTHISFMDAIGPLDSIGYNIAANMRAALLLIEQGDKERERLKRKAEYFAYLIGTGRCPVITKWDGVERHGYVSCIGVSAKAFEHALELAAQKLTDITARAQPTPESK